MFNPRKQAMLSMVALTLFLVGCSSEKSYILDFSVDQPAEVQGRSVEMEYIGELECSVFPLLLREVNVRLAAEGRANEMEPFDSDTYSKDDAAARFIVDNGTLHFVDYQYLPVELGESEVFQLSEDSTMLKFTNNEYEYSCLFPIKRA